jgi:hypothetical protein
VGDEAPRKVGVGFPTSGRDTGGGVAATRRTCRAHRGRRRGAQRHDSAARSASGRRGLRRGVAAPRGRRIASPHGHDGVLRPGRGCRLRDDGAQGSVRAAMWRLRPGRGGACCAPAPSSASRGGRSGEGPRGLLQDMGIGHWDAGRLQVTGSFERSRTVAAIDVGTT